MMDQFTWQGEQGRPLQLKRPCSCGCDSRESDAVGYISGSLGDGAGFTIPIQDHDVYDMVHDVFVNRGLEAEV